MTHASILSPPISVPAPARENLLISLCEAGAVPDLALRFGMRQLCRERLREEHADDPAARDTRFREHLAEWRAGPVAVATQDANRQHYEVPAEFYAAVLGAQLKYSCALWPEGVDSLDVAETAMLDLTCRRAGLADGMRILELGCGWGSLTLWMARAYPGAQIVAVSNSASQREWILRQAAQRGLSNVEVITADVNDWQTSQRFHRVVSVEMFEHVRNHAELLSRIRGWLRPGGALFLHVFCHRELAYPFESRGASDWMTRHFFSGGMMPSYDLFLHYADDLRVRERWWVSGEHYRRTADAWLDRLDQRRRETKTILAHDPRAGQRWRMFFMAVSELFGYDHGRQWGVGHYLMSA